MKYLWLALIPSLALASDFQDQLCGTGTVVVCSQAGLTYQVSYGRILVNVNGVQYVSNYGAVQDGQVVNIPAYATDGSEVLVTANFRTWITKSGRTQLVHWELLAGSVNAQ